MQNSEKLKYISNKRLQISTNSWSLSKQPKNPQMPHNCQKMRILVRQFYVLRSFCEGEEAILAAYLLKTTFFKPGISIETKIKTYKL